MRRSGEVGLWRRLLAMVMALYPESFRRNVGREMQDVFASELQLRREQGRVAANRYGIETVLAAIYGGLRERAHEMGADRAGGHMRAGGPPRGYRDGRTRMIDDVRQDLTVLFRQLRRSPGFAAVVVLTLALGIGVNTGVFSVVRGVLLNPLPYPRSDELVHLTRAGAASFPNIADLNERLESMDELGGASVPETVVLTGAGDAALMRRSFVTPNFFRILGIEPVAGRWLSPEDLGAARAVLSHGLWRTRFSGDAEVIGRTIILDESPVEVVGVAPPTVAAPFDADVWMSLPWGPGEGARGVRTWRAVEPFGRLAEGWTLDAAREELATEWNRLVEEYPEANGRFGIGMETIRTQVTSSEDAPLKLLFLASTLLLLIACANVAGVFLGRLDARLQEFAVRSSLGAGRLRLLRQAWTEALALSVLGGALGLALARGGVEWTLLQFGANLSRADQVAVDSQVLAFGLFVTLLTAVVVGTMTILAWGADEPARAIRQTAASVAGRVGKLKRALVVGEVAMALIMVTGMGLLVRSFLKVQRVDVGLRTDQVLTASLGRFPRSRYPDSASRRALLRQIQEHLMAVPGVEGVAVASHRPLGGCCSNRAMHRGDNPEASVPNVEPRWVTPSYFEVLNIPILSGRSLDELGPDEPGAAMINQVLAERLWGGEDPVGATIADDGSELNIVGVSGSVREYAPTRDAPPIIYLSSEQFPVSRGYLVVRTTLPTETSVPALRSALAGVDPFLPLDGIREMEEVVDAYTADRRATTFLMGLLGLMALILGMVGVYGVMSQVVQGGLRETGVRVALGASRERVARGILKSTMVLVLPGILIGGLGAVAARRFVEALLYEVSSLDPVVYGIVAALFTVVALAAGVGPARQAARVEVVKMLSGN